MSPLIHWKILNSIHFCASQLSRFDFAKVEDAPTIEFRSIANGKSANAPSRQVEN